MPVYFPGFKISGGNILDIQVIRGKDLTPEEEQQIEAVQNGIENLHTLDQKLLSSLIAQDFITCINNKLVVIAYSLVLGRMASFNIDY